LKVITGAKGTFSSHTHLAFVVLVFVVVVLSVPLTAGTPATALEPSDVKTNLEPVKSPCGEGVVIVDVAAAVVDASACTTMVACVVMTDGDVTVTAAVHAGVRLNVSDDGVGKLLA